MRYLLYLLLALPLAACNIGPGGGGGDDDDATGDDDDATGGTVETTITALNADEVELETEVKVSGVVTTRWWNDEGDNQAGFWIQDGSGPGTGILVFSFYDVSLEADKANAFDAGDVVEVTGTFRKPFDFREIVIDSLADVVKTGEGDIPDAHVVPAADISLGFAPDELIGVLVAVEGGTVDESPGWNNYFDWTVDGVKVDSPLFEGDAWMYPDVFEGYTMTRVTGVLHMDFGNAKLMTRWHSDVDFSYPGCDGSWGADTARGVRCNADPGDSVGVGGLIVTATDARIDNAFYAQDPAHAEYGGIQIFSFNEITKPAIGDEISVDGRYTLYDGAAEIIVEATSDISTDSSGNSTDIATEVTDPCTINDAHEGMLVSVPTLDVDAQDSDGEQFGYHIVSGCPGGLIRVGNFFFDDAAAFSDATGGGAGTVTGLVGVVTDSNNTFAINPLGATWTTWGN